jgi:hypothetical protein
MMPVVIVDGGVVPGPGELEAALHALEARKALADRFVRQAGLARCGDGGERVERVVLAEDRQRPAAYGTLSAGNALAQICID